MDENAVKIYVFTNQILVPVFKKCGREKYFSHKVLARI